MKSARLRAIVIAAAFAIAATATGAVRAQSAATGPGATPMDHMMHDHAPAAMPHSQHMAAPSSMSQASDDPRQLVPLPATMQPHMLASMRDHLATLNTVIGDIAETKFDAASRLLEQRLGMSSLPLHHAAEMAPYFPQPMQDAGTNMHRAASRLAIALQNAAVAQTFDAMREADAALHEVTSACVGCHAAYRLR